MSRLVLIWVQNLLLNVKKLNVKEQSENRFFRKSKFRPVFVQFFEKSNKVFSDFRCEPHISEVYTMLTFNEMPAVLEQIQQDLQRVLSLLDNQKEKSKDEDTLLTRQDVKSLFKIHISTLYNWVKSKRLKQISFGGRVYFRRKDLMDLLKK